MDDSRYKNALLEQEAWFLVRTPPVPSTSGPTAPIDVMAAETFAKGR